ncbi:MAG: hypothetical protein ACJ74U_18370 [Jatrophihabitantaceae bacterium]
MRSLTRVAAAALMLGLLATGCASQRHGGSTPASTMKAANPPVSVPCAARRCTPAATITLTDGYSVRLWTYPAPAVSDSATPVVELLANGQHRGWWTGRLGFGWAAKLVCLATAGNPNCVVSSALGAHAGSAEVLVLRSGTLVSSAAASVIFDSSQPSAADLDADGLLDVIGMENDYRPDYAHGHNYWATYRQSAGVLHRTGCALSTAGTAVPTRLLTGACPVVPQD